MILLLLIAIALVIGGFWIIDLPGSSYNGPLPALSEQEIEVRERLHQHIQKLSVDIGPRNHRTPDAYVAAEDYIADALKQAGYVATLSQPGKHIDFTVHNVCCEIQGSGLANQILVVGAHYDTVFDSPGANDNGTGIAALIEMARMSAMTKPARTIRLVAFYNEERISKGPAGSLLYAEDCRRRGDNIVGMISLETIGYYTDAADSQHYPFPFSLFYPSTGNFLAFVANSDSRTFLHDSVRAFRATTQFPTRGLAAPSIFPDAGRSDQVNFWKCGYPGLMVTDTANFRHDDYHRSSDTIDEIDFDCFARVTVGLGKMIAAQMARPPQTATQASPLQ